MVNIRFFWLRPAAELDEMDSCGHRRWLLIRVCAACINVQDMQCTYNATLRGVRVNTVAVEKH
jgi:hypothetical protein